jgi:hypothetical protein
MAASDKYLEEKNLLPPRGQHQEPVVYWLGRLFDTGRKPLIDGGMNLFFAEGNLLYAIYVRAADRSSSLNRLTIVGRVATEEAARERFEISMHTEELPKFPHDDSLSSYRRFVVDTGTGTATMTELDVDDPPSTIDLDPANYADATAASTRGLVAEAVRRAATGHPGRYDPVTSDKARALFKDMATRHPVDQNVLAAFGNL